MIYGKYKSAGDFITDKLDNELDKATSENKALIYLIAIYFENHQPDEKKFRQIQAVLNSLKKETEFTPNHTVNTHFETKLLGLIDDSATKKQIKNILKDEDY